MMAEQFGKMTTMTSAPNNRKLPVRLLGREFSLFSGKACAYLRFKQIPFVESATPKDRASILERVGRQVIPVGVTSDNQKRRPVRIA